MKKYVISLVSIVCITAFSSIAHASTEMDGSIIFVPTDKKMTDYIDKDVPVYIADKDLRAKKKKIQYFYDASLIQTSTAEMMESSAKENHYIANQTKSNQKAKKHAYDLIDEVSIKDTVNYIEIGATGMLYDYVTVSGVDSGKEVTIISFMYDTKRHELVSENGRYLVAKKTFTTKGFSKQTVTMGYQYMNVKIAPMYTTMYDDSMVDVTIRNTQPKKLYTDKVRSGNWIPYRTVLMDKQMIAEMKDAKTDVLSKTNVLTFLKNGQSSGDVEHTAMKPFNKKEEKTKEDVIRKQAELKAKEHDDFLNRLSKQAIQKDDSIPPLSSDAPKEISNNWFYNFIYFFFK